MVRGAEQCGISYTFIAQVQDGNAPQGSEPCTRTRHENNMYYNKGYSEHMQSNHDKQNAKGACVLLCLHTVFLALIDQQCSLLYFSLHGEHLTLDLFYFP